MGEMLLSRAQAAKELDCDPSTISRWVINGTLPGMKIGSKTYVRREALAEMIAGNASVYEADSAPGAEQGGTSWPINAPTHPIGGSISTRREAASRLDDLLGRQTKKKPRR